MSDLKALRVALRQATPTAAWRVGERTFEAGRVALRSRSDDGSEYVFAVTIGPTPSEVTLWPDEPDWEVDPEPPTRGSAHAVAAMLALEQGVEDLEEAAAPPRILLALTTRGDRFTVRGFIDEDGARREAPVPLPASLRADPSIDHLLRTARSWAGGQVPPRAYKALMNALMEADLVELDGAPVEASRRAMDMIVVVDRFGPGYRLRMEDAPEAERVFPGEPTLVLGEGRIQPRGTGRLSELEVHRLSKPVLYAPHELALLTSQRLPELESLIRVVRRDDVPETTSAGLVLRLDLSPRPGGLEVHPRIVYGEPPVAELIGVGLVPLGGLAQFPARDMRQERQLADTLQRELGMRPGERRMAVGVDAARFVRDRLPGFSGTVHAQVDLDRFAQADPFDVQVRMVGERLDVQFVSGPALVGLRRVVEAWQRGDELVALPDGGFAPLPSQWLGEHGAAALHLLEGGGGDGPLPRHLAPVAVDLLQADGGAVPPELASLAALLREAGGIPDLPPPEGLQATLRPYQQVGQAWLRTMEEQGLPCVLADDMGLGKTLQTLAMVLAAPSLGPTLVVAPRSVLRNWRDEAARFAPSLRVASLHGANRAATLRQLDEGAVDLLVTTYGVLRQDVDVIREIPLRCVVLDEAQAIKNPDSKTARAARRLRAKHRVALTGTPIENHLSELWSLFSFLSPGFFGGREHFDRTFGQPASAGEPRAVEALRARVRPFVLRRLKQDVARDLPPRTDIVLRSPMSKAQRKAYETALRGGAWRPDPSDKRPRRMQVLEVLTRLRQACCHPGLLPGGDAEAPSGKLDLLLDHLGPIVEEGHAALVFSQWTSLLDLVEPRLAAAGISFVRLDGSTRDRGAVVDRFQADDGPPVFLISLKAGGTGLNLTRADHVIHLDPWWNPAVERQATDRAHRIGQERPVFAYKLVSEGTVEERILALQSRKMALADAVLEGQGVTALSDDELLELLAPLEE
jgi:hypothetical protein